MPDCWIFLLKRRRALSNVSFSPTRTSANPGSPPPAHCLVPIRPLGATGGANRSSPSIRHRATEPPEHNGAPRTGQTLRRAAGAFGIRETQVGFALRGDRLPSDAHSHETPVPLAFRTRFAGRT